MTDVHKGHSFEVPAEAADRHPQEDLNPLDWASFYVEELKYGPGPGRIERPDDEEMVRELDELLVDAGVMNMTGEELLTASVFYGVNLAKVFRCHPTVTLSTWVDDLMHGIALAGGLKGPIRHEQDTDGV